LYKFNKKKCKRKKYIFFLIKIKIILYMPGMHILPGIEKRETKGVEVFLHLKIAFFSSSIIFYGFGHRAHITQKSQIYSTILHILSEKYRPDLALTLSLYLYGGLFLILHIKYWSTYLYVVIYAQSYHTTIQ
jgi:hypothetical protein